MIALEVSVNDVVVLVEADDDSGDEDGYLLSSWVKVPE